MAKLTIWERVLRLLMTEKGYVLRTLKKQTLAIESSASQFAQQVKSAEDAIVSTIEEQRRRDLKNNDLESRRELVTIKLEGLTAEFQELQAKRKHQDASQRADIIEELVTEQVELDRTLADNRHRAKEQNERVKNLRRSLSEMKSKLRNIESEKDSIIARYNAVQAMDRTQVALTMLDTEDFSEDARSVNKMLSKKEGQHEGWQSVREASEKHQFETLERDLEVQDRLAQYIPERKAINE